jgi:hypothetical protein
MYATTRRYTVKDRGDKDAFTRDVRENFLPLITDIPGFVAYYAIDGGDTLESVSVFETKEGATESTRRAADFVKQVRTAKLSTPEITEGEVMVHAEHGVGAGRAR